MPNENDSAEISLWKKVLLTAAADAVYPFYQVEEDKATRSTVGEWEEAFRRQYRRIVAKTMKAYSLEKKHETPMRLNWFKPIGSNNSSTTSEDIRDGRAFCTSDFGSWKQSREAVCEIVGVCPERLRLQVTRQCEAVDSYEAQYKILLKQLREAE